MFGLVRLIGAVRIVVVVSVVGSFGVVVVFGAVRVVRSFEVVGSVGVVVVVRVGRITWGSQGGLGRGGVLVSRGVRSGLSGWAGLGY